MNFHLTWDMFIDNTGHFDFRFPRSHTVIMTKILIVDDEPRFLESLSLLFEANQFEVATASCGQDALTLLTQQTFDLAILDLHLPDLPGTEIMGDLKDRCPDTIVVFITGAENIDLALSTLKSGAYAYLRKPFEFEELLNKVDHALHQKALQQEQEALYRKLHLAEKKYRYLIQNSPNIVFTLDGGGKFTFISDAVEHLLGFPAADLTGKHYSTVVYEEDHDKAKWSFAERRSRLRTPSGVELRLLMKEDVRQNGHGESYLTVDVKSMAIYEKTSHDGNQRHVGIHGIIQDISDRKRYEERALAANRFLVIGNRHTEMQPLLEAFVEEVKLVSGCCATAVRIIGEDGSIPYAHSTGFDGDFCNWNEPLSIHSEKGMCVHVINNQAASHASCLTAYGSYYVKSTSAFFASASADQTRLMRNTCSEYGFETVALIPIKSREDTIGLIHLADQEQNRLNANTIEIMEAAALQLGTAIERVRAQQALRDSHAKLEKQVYRRTKMLLRTKDELVLEIEQRKKYEQDLLRLQHRLRELSSRLIQTEARERQRIATDIHDRIGQTLAVIKMQLGALKAEFDGKNLKRRVDSIREMVSQTIAEVRTLTFELSPPILHTLGLKAAVDWLAENVRKQSGLSVDVVVDGSDHGLDIDSRGFLFRICNELLLNVVKHAHAKVARVNITIDAEMITAIISDDGLGFDPIAQDGFEPSTRGFGLFSIQEQLQYYGGRYKVVSNPNQGSAVTIKLPLTATGQPEKEGTT